MQHEEIVDFYSTYKDFLEALGGCVQTLTNLLGSEKSVDVIESISLLTEL